MLTLPIAAGYSGIAPETLTSDLQQFREQIDPEASQSHDSEEYTNGLIADLAWVLLLGAIVTLLFKKMKQPVVLGYILAGFLASPKFEYLPSISTLENIEFWADLGIVILMFSIGLEFSFRKLLNSGSSAIVTALIVITGMTFAGFGVGYILDLNMINRIFLGGMISMSSTTIIMKALSDLGMRQRKFATLVLAVLIIEDLFAVLMLVLLSSLAMGDVKGMELFMSIVKLLFFLIIWFVIGVYLVPTFLTKMRSYLNDESLMIVAMALCFSMAIFSVMCGFSLELGAFVMGSILAGTVMAERMERVITPIKNLFGAVFFISVGMMVDPHVLVEFWWEILLLAAVVICGMILFGTMGMLFTGQNLKVAIQSGFTLTQIGEFSFIIASLGMSLGVLEARIYPIIVAVSVLTIFTTPYFISMSDGAYKLIERHLPAPLRFLIDRYSGQTYDTNETKRLWRAILGRYLWRIILYSVILFAEIMISRILLFPIAEKYLAGWGHFAATILTFMAMLPFLLALCFSSTKPSEKMRLHQTAAFYDVPLLAMKIIRYLVALFFVVYFTSVAAESSIIGWFVGAGCFILVLLFASSRLMKRYKRMEKKFLDNLNMRENERLGVNNNLIDDMHQAFIEIDQSTPFVGDRLKDSGLRRDYGVSVASIQRGDDYMPLPSKDARVFPGDVLGVIGSDEQLRRLNDDLTKAREGCSRTEREQRPVELSSVQLTDGSPVVGIPLGMTDFLHDFGAMVVKVMRNGVFCGPDPSLVLNPNDVVWVVGDPEYFDAIAGKSNISSPD